MKINDACSKLCPDRMKFHKDDGYFKANCQTTDCMAWVTDGIDTGYCTSYGKESESKHYYNIIENMS